MGARAPLLPWDHAATGRWSCRSHPVTARGGHARTTPAQRTAQRGRGVQPRRPTPESRGCGPKMRNPGGLTWGAWVAPGTCGAPHTLSWCGRAPPTRRSTPPRSLQRRRSCARSLSLPPPPAFAVANAGRPRPLGHWGRWHLGRGAWLTAGSCGRQALAPAGRKAPGAFHGRLRSAASTLRFGLPATSSPLHSPRKRGRQGRVLCGGQPPDPSATHQVQRKQTGGTPPGAAHPGDGGTRARGP